MPWMVSRCITAHARDAASGRPPEEGRIAIGARSERFANRWKDCLNKLAYRLIVRSNRIALEDLCITTMVRNWLLATSILDAGWGYVIYHLTRTAAEAVRVALPGDHRATSRHGFGVGMASSLVRFRIGGWIAAVDSGWIATIPPQRPS